MLEIPLLLQVTLKKVDAWNPTGTCPWSILFSVFVCLLLKHTKHNICFFSHTGSDPLWNIHINDRLSGPEHHHIYSRRLCKNIPAVRDCRRPNIWQCLPSTPGKVTILAYSFQLIYQYMIRVLSQSNLHISSADLEQNNTILYVCCVNIEV